MNLGSLGMPLEVTKELNTLDLVSLLFVAVKKKYTVENKYKIPSMTKYFIVSFPS